MTRYLLTNGGYDPKKQAWETHFIMHGSSPIEAARAAISRWPSSSLDRIFCWDLEAGKAVALPNMHGACKSGACKSGACKSGACKGDNV